MKSSAGFRQTKHRGRERVGRCFNLATTAYNLIRSPKLLALAAWTTRQAAQPTNQGSERPRSRPLFDQGSATVLHVRTSSAACSSSRQWTPAENGVAPGHPLPENLTALHCNIATSVYFTSSSPASNISTMPLTFERTSYLPETDVGRPTRLGCRCPRNALRPACA